MLLASTVFFLALTRAEIVERFKSPVVTQAEGFVQVYGNCAVDLRREFQSPIARFIGDTIRSMADAQKRKLVRAPRPGIVVHLGDIRTNQTDVIVRVSTNYSTVLTRIFLPSPAHADLARLRTETVQAYYRSFLAREITSAEAQEAYRMTDPDYRIGKERQYLDDWLSTAAGDDAEGLKRLYRVLKPGSLARVEARVFASRLRLYPVLFDRPFLRRWDVLTFDEAIAARSDPQVRLAALLKSNEMPIFGGGRGPGLKEAAEAYRVFLSELARGEKGSRELKELLDVAETKLNVVYEETK